MANINNTDVVKGQYKNAGNLNARISIHEKYSTNKQGFGNWIYAQYKIGASAKVLELGCGTGSMWADHLEILSTGAELILTDFSEGMIETAKKNLGEHQGLSYGTVDIQNIPYEDESFDVVIANMMLYHVPDLQKGLSEVRRVLKPEGTFYCATYGEHGIMEYIENALAGFGVSSDVSREFTLQSGGAKLADFFRRVERMEYEDSLAVTDTEDMIEYVYSLSGLTNLESVDRAALREILESRKENGILNIPKEYGMFLCRK